MNKQDSKAAVEQRITDGKLERALSKNEKEQSEMIMIGGGGKKKKGKKPKKDVIVTEVFNLDISVIGKFSFLKVSPPLGLNDLDSKIDELKTLRDKFVQDGEAKLKEIQENGLDEEEE